MGVASRHSDASSSALLSGSTPGKSRYRTSAFRSDFTCPVSALIRTWLAFVERTVARDHLPAADRAPFDIASRHVKLALDHATIMAGLLIGSPIVVLVTVPNSANISPLDCVGRTLLGCEYLFRPALDHRNAAIQDAFRFAHFLRRGLARWLSIVET
jgi:hypothetical protein